MTKAGLIAKWVIAPVVLALLGYFFVGPNLGKVAGAAPKSPQSTANEPPNADPPAPSGTTAIGTEKPGPDVTVDVHKVDSSATAVAEDAPRPPRRKHHKTGPKPADQADAPKPPSASTPPTKDEGGSAGSTTAG